MAKKINKKQLLDIVSTATTVIGLAMSLVGSIVDGKRQTAEINEAVAQALAKQQSNTNSRGV